MTTYPLDLVAHNVVIDEDADMLYLVGSGAALGTGSVCTVGAASTTDEDYPRVAYSHQGWMSEDQAFYLHGDELDETGTEPTRTFVFDIRDLDDIALHFVNEPGGVNIDHNADCS